MFEATEGGNANLSSYVYRFNADTLNARLRIR